MGPKTVINGNVAIGNPSTIDAKLHVVGDVKIEGLADGSTTKMVVAEPDGKLSTKTLSINTSTDGTSTTTTLSGSNIELGDPANPVSNVNVNGSIELPLSANSSSSTTAGITLDGFTTSKFSYNSLSLKRYGFGFHNPTQSTTSSNGSFISGYGGIDFFTSDNNRLSIKQSGKVGIGTDDPKERLQLGDLFTFHTGGTKMIGRNVYWDNDAGYSKKILSVETNGVLPSSSALKFNADGSIGFSVDNNTADPNDATGFKIKWINPFNISKSGNIVLGDPNTTDFPSTLTVNSSLNFKTLQDKSGDASAKMLVWNSTDYSVGTKEITGLCDDITCDGNGHVGIGTTTPNAQIHIKGKNSQSPKIRFEDIVGLAQYQSIWDISQSSNGLEFLHGTFGSNPVSKFKISEWGHIGIGAPSPQAILHIKSDGSGFEENGNVLPIVENTGTGAAGWKFLTGGGINGPYWIIHAAGGSNQGLGKFVFRSDSVEVMTLTREKKDGWNDVRRVGIGTTSPTSNLQVQNAENTDIRVKSTGSNKTALLWAANNNFGLAFGIGTDNKGHIYYNETSPQESMTFLNNGNVGIGTPTPDEKLQVKGNIKACKVIVANPGGGWCDYVFDDKYKLPSLFDVEQYVKQHKHLPDVPSEKEVTENGIDVGQMNTILLKKIEELTLYSIEQQKQLEKQQLQISSLINDVEKIKK
ncbi:MAG: hypothetical protein A2046_09020 [Bacteroidetes bacterium GWA2_30_7]|nr:MAG: hypothetical protein A2046_09020 [Bacteroidetes bacterium GWA2_30_7]